MKLSFSLVSSALFVLAAMPATAQIATVKQFASGNKATGVNAFGLTQIVSQGGQVAVYRLDGSVDHYTQGYDRGVGLGNDVEYAGVTDPTGFPAAFVVAGSSGFPLGLDGGYRAAATLTYVAVNSGMAAFTAIDDQGNTKQGAYDGEKPAYEVLSDGTWGVSLLTLTSASDAGFGGIGFGSNSESQAFAIVNGTFVGVTAAVDERIVDFKLNVDGDLARAVGILRRADGSYYGTAWDYAGGAFTGTGLVVDGATVAASPWGTLGAFGGTDAAYSVDLSTGMVREAFEADGVTRLAGTDALFVNALGTTFSGGYGVNYAPVPEPASLAVLAMGLVAVARRRGAKHARA